MTNNPFAPLVGQKQAIELLTQAVKQNRVAPAYLFAGPDGVGRSLAARCFVELLFASVVEARLLPSLQQRLRQGNHPDLLWVQPTYQYQGQRFTAAQAAEKKLKRKAPPLIRLEQIREITEFLSRPPLEAPRNVVVLEEAQTMAEPAANALLKTLEEPGQATIVLITPSPESVLPTLVSRCQRIPFYSLDTTSLTQVLTQTGNQAVLQHPALLSLASGSPGSAIASYEQLQTIPPDLLQDLTTAPKSQRHALELAKRIDKDLETEAQLWLVDYLQQSYWQKRHLPGIISQLEKARKYLLVYAQPRLVWECTLLSVYQEFNI
ncbi:DNA polymerase III, delta prime subunit [Trichormus variabilis ATCC 29413]|uniref:DNA polymerase III, delta prime subunit n=2 Tax=Anabaena variabilis TaxID=264691 RepID=Q3MBQ1_TRIV2|nr:MULTISPECIES: DNA polymerase III subunit delta' [Nostocaceae]ABA21585.1 DNA polymerase III, delta prime subunit [Trichormus variabilis ATCC 29413]MBC1214547.1 DNA polymerase III subunit delta' [Trichormus variabilis ARAD]MBC1258036.1 DNA polymerase III subunit delta' [Trichormus variabilis V5]MBC1266218.1 DNA polymerase III subunit delta' [Trichormus variabilis FSR]MBC1301637.1 DNA polymerase III subunit delta' [Trichormus variabilis N2B]